MLFALAASAAPAASGPIVDETFSKTILSGADIIEGMVTTKTLLAAEFEKNGRDSALYSELSKVQKTLASKAKIVGITEMDIDGTGLDSTDLASADTDTIAGAARASQALGRGKTNGHAHTE